MKLSVKMFLCQLLIFAFVCIEVQAEGYKHEMELYEFIEVAKLPKSEQKKYPKGTLFVEELHIGRTHVTVYDDDGVFGTLCFLAHMKYQFYKNRKKKEIIEWKTWNPVNKALSALISAGVRLSNNGHTPYKVMYDHEICKHTNTLSNRSEVKIKNFKVFDKQKEYVKKWQKQNKKKIWLNYTGDAYGSSFKIKFSFDGAVSEDNDYLNNVLKEMLAIDFKDRYSKPGVKVMLSYLDPNKGDCPGSGYQSVSEDEWSDD